MATWDIGGAWIGEYRYDPILELPELPPPTSFTLEAHCAWLGRLRGTIQDDTTRGAFQPATMSGRVCRTTIWFRKQYPEYYVCYQGRLITIEEQLEEEQGILLDESPTAPPIWYCGQYDEERRLVTGTWRIKRGKVRLRVRGKLYIAIAVGASGTWQMQRKTV